VLNKPSEIFKKLVKEKECKTKNFLNQYFLNFFETSKLKETIEKQPYVFQRLPSKFTEFLDVFEVQFEIYAKLLFDIEIAEAQKAYCEA
jgi:hypothetical protein